MEVATRVEEMVVDTVEEAMDTAVEAVVVMEVVV